MLHTGYTRGQGNGAPVPFLSIFLLGVQRGGMGVGKCSFSYLCDVPKLFLVYNDGKLGSPKPLGHPRCIWCCVPSLFSKLKNFRFVLFFWKFLSVPMFLYFILFFPPPAQAFKTGKTHSHSTRRDTVMFKIIWASVICFLSFLPCVLLVLPLAVPSLVFPGYHSRMALWSNL